MEWFWALLLVVLIAGYVFLFLQGRLLRAEFAELARGLADLRGAEARLREVLERKGPAEEPPPVLQELGPGLAALQAALERIQAEMLELRAAAARLLERPPPEEPPAAPVAGPEEVARRHLLEEGFSRIQVTGSQQRGLDVRLLVRAFRGDQLRAGHVLVREGRVVEAALRVPTTAFP
jgi:hypothetical protein